MQFELTPEVLDRIIFAMEDQTATSLIDPSNGEVFTEEEAEEAEETDRRRLVHVPEWTPVQGYQLMERFATGLRNPALREEVRAALGAGRGVFRAFKDALKRHPEIEKRWYLFKEREMRRVVLDWYNRERELQGLERLRPEPSDDPESSEELIRADFLFSTGVEGRQEALASADRAAFGELYARLAGEEVERLYRKRLAKYPPMAGAESVVVVAEDHAGQIAGFAWGAYHPAPFAPAESWKILQLVVIPAYRGIGLGSSLLRRLLEQASDRGAAAVFVDLPGPLLACEPLFAAQGFEPAAKLLGIDVSAWAARGSRG